MTARTLATLATMALALSGLAGCQASKRKAPEPIAPRQVPVFSGDATGVVPWENLVEACADASVVLIGETHAHPLGLAVAAELFDDVLARNPHAQLSMEFYERDSQVPLDDYLAGITTAQEFDAASFRTESNNPPAHRQMLEAARLAGRPVVAANAPRRYARLARTEGYDRLRNLSAEQRRLFEIPDSIPENGYASRFRAAMGGMGGHGDDPAMSADAFLRAQLLWDATMADSVADAIPSGEPVVHVVGSFHADYGTEPGKSALTDAIAQRLLPDQNVIIVTIVDVAAQSLRVEDVGRAHFVIYVGAPEPAEKKK